MYSLFSFYKRMARTKDTPKIKPKQGRRSSGKAIAISKQKKKEKEARKTEVKEAKAHKEELLNLPEF